MASTVTSRNEPDQLFGRDMLENPYPRYRDLQTKAPVYWDEGLKAWVVTRHDTVSAVLKDKRFSNDRVSPARERYPNPIYRPLFDTLSLLMLQRDDPDHRRLRNLVQHAFARTAIQDYSPRIVEIVDGMLAKGIAHGQMDFVRDLAVPLPIMVISDIVGIPTEDRAQIKTWCDDFSVVALNFYTGCTDQQLQRGLFSVLGFKLYLKRKVEELRAQPNDSLLSNLVTEEEAGERLTLDELLANVLLLLNAGNETTTGMLTNGLLALLRNPDQLAKLRNQPALAERAVEEFLRYDPPVQFIGRIALEEITLQQQTVAAGDLVLVVMAAAGHDPEVFDEPESLDVARSPCRHLSFGSGQHLCVGVQLARLEGQIVFERLARVLKTIAIEPEHLEHGSNFNMRCLKSLPIRLAA